MKVDGASNINYSITKEGELVIYADCSNPYCFSSKSIVADESAFHKSLPLPYEELLSYIYDRGWRLYAGKWLCKSCYKEFEKGKLG